MSEVTHEEIKNLLQEQTSALGVLVDTKLEGQTQAIDAKLEKHTHSIDAKLEKQTEAILGLVKLEFEPINKRLDRHDAILEMHTTTLDRIAKNTDHWRTEAAALKAGFDRHENWFEQLAKKLGIKFS